MLFDGQTITIEHLLNKTTYSTDKQSESDNQYTYYRFENEVASEISEKDYKEALSELEENDNWVEINFISSNHPISDIFQLLALLMYCHNIPLRRIHTVKDSATIYPDVQKSYCCRL